MINPDCLQGQEFLNIFINQYETFKQMGFKHYEILRMLGTLDFVKDFADTPDWLVSAKKLPKGYKWSDGTKFHKKQTGKKDEAEQYVFLIVDDDLYIKGMLDKLYEVHDNVELNEYGYPKLLKQRDRRICVIKGWKARKSHKVVYQLDGISPFLQKCICDFWNENGGKMSMQEDNLLLEMLANELFSQSCIEPNKG